MSTLIGRWRRLWQQPFVRLLREKYRKFRFGFPPSPFSLAFLFAKGVGNLFKKKKRKKRTFYGISDNVPTQEMEDIPPNLKKKKDWKKMSKGADKFVHESLHEILMESLIQSSPNSFGQYLPTPGNQPLFSTPATVSLHP